MVPSFISRHKERVGILGEDLDMDNICEYAGI